eukprot:118273_1
MCESVQNTRNRFNSSCGWKIIGTISSVGIAIGSAMVINKISKYHREHNTVKKSPTSTDSNNTRSFIKNSKLNIKINASRPEPSSFNQSTNKLPFDNEFVLQNLILAQIEYLFSDYHLCKDTYLLARMQDNSQHWLSIDELCHHQKIRCLNLTNKKERILQALCESKFLELASDNERVRRPNFTLPKLKPNRDLRSTVFLYGIPPHKTEQYIRKVLSQYGHIKRIHFQSTNNNNNNSYDDEVPNICVAQLIMKIKFLLSDVEHPMSNPNGDTQDFSYLKTCFVVFESQSQATKCMNATSRALDG